MHTLMVHRELIVRNHTIYLIVDYRSPRRCLVGPQEEATRVLWVCADATMAFARFPTIGQKFLF